MNISEKLIRDNCNDIIFERGEGYYKSGRVVDFTVEKEYHKNGGFTAYTIEASVEESYFDEHYVEVMFNDKSGFMSANCGCPFFIDNHRKLGFCKHVVAVLLKFFREYYKGDEISSTKNKLDKLLKDIKYNTLKLSDIKKNLKLEIYYNYNLYENLSSSLELRIGLEKTYVVKNIKQFLQAVERVQELEFGKGFIFKPLEQQFTPEDRKIIEFLLETSEIDYMIDKEDGRNSSLLTGKKVYVLDRQLSRLFALLKDRTINANIQGIQYDDVRILYEDMPLEFEMVKGKNDIVLYHGEEVPRPLSGNGKFFFYQGNIYSPSNEQLRLYVPLYNVFMSERSRKVQFDIGDGHRVASYLIPSLKAISKDLKLDSSIKDSFYEAPLIAKIYLDKDNSGISADVKFNYGNFDISALKDEAVEAAEGILLRDVAKEALIVSGIESFGFRRGQESFRMDNEEDLMRFLTEGINKIKELCQVYYSDSFKALKIYNSSNIIGGVKVNNEDLLEFNFGMEDINPREMRSILQAVKQKKKYYRLKDGGFVDLQDRGIKDALDIIDYLNINEKELFTNGSAIIPKYNAFYIDGELKSELGNFRKDFTFNNLINNMKELQEENFTLPSHLNSIMRSYQKEGFKWLKTLAHYGFGGILADEMGLGKTLQTIAFIASEKSERPSLVIAPTSLVYNWQAEVEKFAPELKCIVISGTPEERDALRSTIHDYNMVITSYPLLRRDIDSYKSLEFNYCILDEAQHIKNPASQSTNAVKAVKADAYFAITGTPLENSLTELWSIFDFIMPGYLFNHNKFVEKYEMPIIRNEDEEALKALNKHITPFILRRLKKQVMTELPPKIEQRLIVDMTVEQRKLYNAYLYSARQEIEEEVQLNGFNNSKFKILSILTRLRQICCDPSVFAENYVGESGKMEALEELLEEMIAQKHRVLIFSQFTTVLKNIAARLDKRSTEYLYLDGSTPAVDRGSLVRSFNSGNAPVFLASLKAGGTGLNLTGADVVVHFDPWWNPAVESQAADRAHRIGQKKTVEVIKLIARNSIEEKIYNLQERKKEVFDKVIDDGEKAAGMLVKMSVEDIRDILK